MTTQPLQLEYRTSGAARPKTYSPIRNISGAAISIGAWCGMVIFVMGIPAGIGFAIGGYIMEFWGVVVGILLLPMLAAVSRAVRRRRAAIVLRYVAQAVRLNRPIARILVVAAHGERGRVASLLRGLADALDSGVSLSQGLAFAVREMPRRTVSIIHDAERTGQLARVLPRLMHEDMADSRADVAQSTFIRWYPGILLLTATGTIAMCEGFVFPQYVNIFRDFHFPLPPVTRWVINDTQYLMIPAMLLVAAMWVMCATQIRDTFRGASKNPLMRGLRDWAIWMLPISRDLARDRAVMDVSQSLGDSLTLGRPLEQALIDARLLEVNQVMRRRVKQWGDAVSAGVPLDEAARRARLPGFLVGMLATAKSSPDLAEVFHFLAHYYGSRFRRWRELVRGAYIPAVTLLMALLVGGIAVALILPFQQMVDHLTPNIGGL